MNREIELRGEAKAAMVFGKILLSSGQDVVPMMVVTRSGDENRLLLAPPPFDDQTKEPVFAMMAVAARIWGGTDIVLMTDSYFRRVEPEEQDDYDIDHPVLPSQDPKAVEALMVHVFRADGPDFGQVQPYHRGPEGITFDEIEDLPESFTRDGMMVKVIHQAFRRTDEQVVRLMTEMNEVMPVGSIEDPTPFFEVLRDGGFAVMEGR